METMTAHAPEACEHFEADAAEVALHPHRTRPPERVANFVRRVIRGEKFYAGPERRMHLRYPITMPVQVTPLDAEFEPVGEPYQVVSRDISVGGICLYGPQATNHRYLQLEIKGPSQERLKVLMEVLRCRQAGPFFEIGGRFIGEA
jgi:hypothetical protein